MMGAVAVFFLTLSATIPAILPLLITDHPSLALRVSNGLVIGSLFFCWDIIGQNILTPIRGWPVSV
jgi:hypothetical protein